MATKRHFVQRETTQANKQPDYRDPALNANSPNSHNISDGTENAKGLEIVAALMNNVTDPYMLW